MSSPNTLRNALVGRDVAIAFALIVALYLLKFILFQPVQVPPYLLIVAYDFVEVAIPVLTPYHPVAFPVFLYVLAIGGPESPGQFDPRTVGSHRGCRRSGASVSSSEPSPWRSARSSAARSSPRRTTRRRWPSLTRRASFFSGSPGGCSADRRCDLPPPRERIHSPFERSTPRRTLRGVRGATPGSDHIDEAKHRTERSADSKQPQQYLVRSPNDQLFAEQSELLTRQRTIEREHQAESGEVRDTDAERPGNRRSERKRPAMRIATDDSHREKHYRQRQEDRMGGHA